MNFLGVTKIRELIDNKSQQIIESDIKAYLIYLRTKKKISYGSALLYLSVIKKFYVVNTDYPIKWNLINMYLGNDDTEQEQEPEGGEGGEDNNNLEYLGRPYTKEEIQKMFNAAQDISKTSDFSYELIRIKKWSSKYSKTTRPRKD